MDNINHKLNITFKSFPLYDYFFLYIFLTFVIGAEFFSSITISV